MLDMFYLWEDWSGARQWTFRSVRICTSYQVLVGHLDLSNGGQISCLPQWNQLQYPLIPAPLSPSNCTTKVATAKPEGEPEQWSGGRARHCRFFRSAGPIFIASLECLELHQGIKAQHERSTANREAKELVPQRGLLKRMQEFPLKKSTVGIC